MGVSDSHSHRELVLDRNRVEDSRDWAANDVAALHDHIHLVDC